MLKKFDKVLAKKEFSTTCWTNIGKMAITRLIFLEHSIATKDTRSNRYWIKCLEFNTIIDFKITNDMQLSKDQRTIIVQKFNADHLFCEQVRTEFEQRFPDRTSYQQNSLSNFQLWENLPSLSRFLTEIKEILVGQELK